MVEKVDKDIRKFIRDQLPMLLMAAGVKYDYIQTRYEIKPRSDRQREALNALNDFLGVVDLMPPLLRTVFTLKCMKWADYSIAREIGYEIAQTRRLRTKSFAMVKQGMVSVCPYLLEGQQKDNKNQ